MSDRAPPKAAERLHRRAIEAVDERIRDWYGPGARRVGEAPVEVRAWSVHLRPVIRTRGREITLVVKIPTWKEAPDLDAALAAGPQEGTRRESEVLEAIRAMVAAARDPGLTAVVPVAYVPEINAVVTEMLDAVPLRSLLRPGCWARARIALAGTGRWLRLFHETIGGAATGPFPAAEIHREIESVHRVAADRRAPGLIGEVLEEIGERARRLSGSECVLAATHGDLGPSNILVDRDGRVAVIDPNGVDGPAVGDLAKLATAVRTAPIRLLSGLPRSPVPIPSERALLQEYRPADHEVMALARGLSGVRRWLDVESGATGLRRPFAIGARRVLRSELDYALSGLDSSGI